MGETRILATKKYKRAIWIILASEDRSGFYYAVTYIFKSKKEAKKESLKNDILRNKQTIIKKIFIDVWE